MITIVIILILISFLQATIMPINLVLIILICRSFVSGDKANFFLAFGLGLFLALLQGYLIGSLSLIYLLAAGLVYFIKNTRFAENIFVVLLSSSFLLSIDQLMQGMIKNFSFNFWWILLGIILTLPVFMVLRFWEDRFIPKKEVKLKY